jgi:hypothetical protein
LVEVGFPLTPFDAGTISKLVVDPDLNRAHQLDYAKPQSRPRKWIWRMLIGVPLLGSVQALVYRAVFCSCAAIGMTTAPKPLFELLFFLRMPGFILFPRMQWEWEMFWNAAIWGFSGVGLWYAWEAIRIRKPEQK